MGMAAWYSSYTYWAIWYSPKGLEFPFSSHRDGMLFSDIWQLALIRPRDFKWVIGEIKGSSE